MKSIISCSSFAVSVLLISSSLQGRTPSSTPPSVTLDQDPEIRTKKFYQQKGLGGGAVVGALVGAALKDKKWNGEPGKNQPLWSVLGGTVLGAVTGWGVESLIDWIKTRKRATKEGIPTIKPDEEREEELTDYFEEVEPEQVQIQDAVPQEVISEVQRTPSRLRLRDRARRRRKQFDDWLRRTFQ